MSISSCRSRSCWLRAKGEQHCPSRCLCVTAREGEENPGSPVHTVATLAPATTTLVPGRLAREQGRVQVSIELKWWEVRVGIPRRPFAFLRRPNLIWFLIELCKGPTVSVFSRFPQDTSQPPICSCGLPHFCFHQAICCCKFVSYSFRSTLMHIPIIQ